MDNVLITGTTSGIGKAFAEKFASMGNNVILVSRDMQKLKQQQLYLQTQYHVAVNFIAYDLSKEDAADLVMERKRQILMRSDTKLPQPFVSWSNSL